MSDQERLEEFKVTADLSRIPVALLLKDLSESKADLAVCEIAREMGIKATSGGALIETRIHVNEMIIEAVTNELRRRGALQNGN